MAWEALTGGHEELNKPTLLCPRPEEKVQGKTTEIPCCFLPPVSSPLLMLSCLRKNTDEEYKA